MVSSRKEIRDSVLSTTRQPNAQIGNLVNEFINITLNEINDPAWSFPRKNYSHMWSFLRGKTSFSTVADTSDYVLPREIDHIALMRQTASPTKIDQIPDEKFFDLVPNPTDTGNPTLYRLWENEGVATRLAAADTIDVVSDSASDAGSAELAVTVSGYVSGIWRTETFQLNGTTAVTGFLTFDAREIFVSKQKDTTGTITVSENSGSTSLVTLGPKERSPRFKVVSLYPIPSSAISIFVEYYRAIPELENDSDTPIFNKKWHHVVRLGALAKVYEYLKADTTFQIMQNLYSRQVRAMVATDKANPDLLRHLSPRGDRRRFIHLRRTEDAVAP